MDPIAELQQLEAKFTDKLHEYSDALKRLQVAKLEPHSETMTIEIKKLKGELIKILSETTMLAKRISPYYETADS